MSHLFDPSKACIKKLNLISSKKALANLYPTLQVDVKDLQVSQKNHRLWGRDFLKFSEDLVLFPSRHQVICKKRLAWYPFYSPIPDHDPQAPYLPAMCSIEELHTFKLLLHL